MIVTRAHCDGHLHRNPFAQYHASLSVKERQFLTEEELQILMNHSFAMMSFSQIRDMFVFGCFTGISYIDIKHLTTDNLIDINGSWWIIANRKKTEISEAEIRLERLKQEYEPYKAQDDINLLLQDFKVQDAKLQIFKEQDNSDKLLLNSTVKISLTGSNRNIRK